MTSFGPDWDSFAPRHLHHWHGRALVVSPNAKPLRSTEYTLSTTSVAPSRTNPRSLHVKSLIHCAPNAPHQFTIRYDLDNLHCFADGAYAVDHSLLHLPLLLPNSSPAPSAIELALTVSASERVRVFLLYDNQRNLSSVVLLEEVRAGLFDTRAPVALTSLVGEWRGQAETFRHPSPQSRPLDSAKYSPDDLPPQLKNPSSTGDGLLRTATTVSFAWDPAKATVRRATILRDMSDNQLGSSVVYGLVDEAGMFDIARFDTHSSSESLLLTLTNACFISAPIKRIRGVSASAELACLVTPTFRRRILRIYGTNSVVSDTLASESLI